MDAAHGFAVGHASVLGRVVARGVDVDEGQPAPATITPLQQAYLPQAQGAGAVVKDREGGCGHFLRQ